MRTPAVALHDNLMWTRSGVVWATWRVHGLDFGFATDQAKRLVRAHHQALLQSLRGEALLMGVCADLDPTVVVQRMIDGVDLRRNTDWREMAELTLASLEQIQVGERAFFLSVPLTATSIVEQVRQSVSGGLNTVRSLAALPLRVPTPGEIDRLQRRARTIEESIPMVFRAEPVTPAQHVWLGLHAQLRGLRLGTSLPQSTAESATLSGAAIPEPWVDEGGQSDVGRLAQLAPFTRRYLKLVSPLSDETANYQVLQALISVPKEGWQFPGYEWLARVDQLPVDVDWSLRLDVVPAARAKRANKRSEVNLNDQLWQQSTDFSITGTANDLTTTAEALAAYQTALNASEREVSVQFTTILSTAAPTADEARARARMVAEDFRRADFVFDAVLGDQEELWWAMQPGVPTRSGVRELAQLTTGRNLAAAVPLISTDLGDERGILLGYNISTGQLRPLLFDPAGAIMSDLSGSVAIVGDLGSGKSVTLKIIGISCFATGAAIVAIDSTKQREYAVAFSALDDDVTVVDVLEPRYSLDPMRVFPPQVAGRVVQSLFATMLGIGVRGKAGAFLAKVLAPDYLIAHELTSLPMVRAHLAGLDNDTATEIADLLGVVADKDLGRVLFDDTLPPVSLDSRGLIFCTEGLRQPSAEELQNEHLFETMEVEKIFGHALYSLLASIAREVCFTDRTRLAMFLVDEIKHMSRSPQGESILEEFVLQGRKDAAAVAFAGQDVEHFGSSRVRSFIPTRIVMHQHDEEAARKSMVWLGSDDADVVKLIQDGLSPRGHDGKVVPGREGECIIRDARARTGLAKIALPAPPQLRDAILTTPTISGRSRQP